MEENPQETNFISEKKGSFISKNISKTTLIIVVCSLVCFLSALLLFSFISNNRKNQAKSFARPSINAPRKPVKKHFEENQQQSEQMQQMQSSEQNSKARNSERSTQEYRNPRGIHKGETSEQAHARHMREREARKDPNYRMKMITEAKERKRNMKKQRRRQSNSQTESNRPRLNS